jgi:hypothetical protein
MYHQKTEHNSSFEIDVIYITFNPPHLLQSKSVFLLASGCGGELFIFIIYTELFVSCVLKVYVCTAFASL